VVRTLSDTPTAHTFDGVAGRATLVAQLEANLAHTVVAAPQTPRDIRLDPNTCRTQSGMRYINTALTKMCRFAAPGLSQLLSHVAAARSVTVREDDAFSHRTACAVFNEVIDLRFQQLGHCQLVSNHGARIIEGVLGPRTVHLDHLTLFELADSVFTDAGGVFSVARMSGRRLYLLYQTLQAVAVGRHVYRLGYVLVANEAGDDAIACYHHYGHPDGYGFLRRPPASPGRKRRVGNQLRDRIQAMFASAVQPAEQGCTDAISAAAGRPLFTSTDRAHIDRTLRLWVRRMRLVGVPAGVAEDITARLPLNPNGVGWLSSDALLARTEYDIMVLLMQAGAERSARVQEVLQRAAAKLFSEDDE
jgi:hypothetical protein